MCTLICGFSLVYVSAVSSVASIDEYNIATLSQNTRSTVHAVIRAITRILCAEEFLIVNKKKKNRTIGDRNWMKKERRNAYNV